MANNSVTVNQIEDIMSNPTRRNNLLAALKLQQELDKPRPYLNKVRSIIRCHPGILSNSSIPNFPLALPIVVLCTGCHEHLTQDDRTNLIKLFAEEGIKRNVCGPNGRGGLMINMNLNDEQHDHDREENNANTDDDDDDDHLDASMNNTMNNSRSSSSTSTSVNQESITCFHMLVGKNDVRTLQALASMNPPLLHPRDVWELDLIALACCRGYTDVVKCLIELSPESLHTKSGQGNYPIFAAAMRGHEEIFQYLLKKGREYRSFGGDYGNVDETMGGLFVGRTYKEFPSDAMFTPLDCWVLHRKNKWNMFAPKLRDTLHGFPLLQQAMKTSMRYGMNDVLESLVTHFDCGNIKDKEKKYPLHIAAELGLPWEHGMKYILESNRIALSIIDTDTNLPLFALAAARTQSLIKGPWKRNDLSSIFEILRSHPGALIPSSDDADVIDNLATSSDSTRKRRRLR